MAALGVTVLLVSSLLTACGGSLLDPSTPGVRYELFSAADTSLPVRLEPGSSDFTHGSWYSYVYAAELVLTPADSAVLAVRLRRLGEQIDSTYSVTHAYEVERQGDSLRFCQARRSNVGQGTSCMSWGSLLEAGAVLELQALFIGPPGSGITYRYRRQ